MFSAREVRLRTTPSLATNSAELTRLALKDSLHHLFLQYPGLASLLDSYHPDAVNNGNNNSNVLRKRQTVFSLQNTTTGEAEVGLVEEVKPRFDDVAAGLHQDNKERQNRQ
ncbi:hypothetical protein N0V88_007561 [Collariella sp. IMI 366227]|nr:hypothetical protein N0V88_007561 [Collariella sp. IMI 366227]